VIINKWNKGNKKIVWYDLNLKGKKIKYTPLNPDIKEYPDCDKDGNILKRVSGKFEKGHFINEETGETHEKAFKLINGKASSGWTGKIKDVDNPIYCDIEQAEDLLTEKEYLVESDSLFNELTEKNQAVKFSGWFGNGYKVYRVFITPSKLYKGFFIMRCGRGLKSEIIRQIVGDLTEHRELQKMLAQVDVTIAKVNQANIDDILNF